METLIGILSDLGFPQETLREETYIKSNLGLDSVETVRLSLELKRRLNIDIKLGNRQDLTLIEICRQAIHG
jgi:acyl carrier protein